MKKLRLHIFVLIALALGIGAIGCGDDDDSTGGAGNSTKDGGGGSGGKNGGKSGSGGSSSKDKDGGTSGSGGDNGGSDKDGGGSGSGGSSADGGGASGSGGSGSKTDCPALDDREEVDVEAEITKDTTWTCDKLYIMSSLTFITDAKLTIEAGTVVLGDSGSALISARGAQLITKGTADAPVVFTSSADEGKRAPSDWGGVVMLGSAPINIGDENRVEGIEATDDRGLYGGSDASSNCGSLEYTRIEFAGYELSVDNELNGLTLGGCGTDTKISHVQVHYSSDDGIECFGGSPKLDHILLTGNADDGLDLDFGNTAQVQFLVIQQDPKEADSAFEWNNQTMGDDDATPRTKPTVYNATIIGGGKSTGPQNGLTLRQGTAGIIKNVIVMGFPVGGVDVRDVSTVHGTESDPPILTVENSLFFKNGPDGKSHFGKEPTDGSSLDNDGSFDEAAYFSDDSKMNVFDEDPKLGDPFSLTKPNYVPAKDSPAADGAATPPSGFDAKAKYKGAFEPGGTDWTKGWTTHVQN